MASVPTSGAAAPPPPPVWDATPQPAAVRYAGFWIRFVAYLIDSVVLSIAGSIIGAIFGVGLAMSGGGERSLTAGAYLIGVVVAWLYFALMESSERGATLGKMAVGVRVVTEQGQRLSFANATGRYFAKFISAIILCIGFIMIAFTDRKRGLHDMIAGTLVIKSR
jgi:uncharacterized RDD family membrane protein YckC